MVLAARHQVRFDHHADDALVAAGDLAADVFAHRDLVLMLLAAVGMRGIDHQARGQPGLGDGVARFLHAGGIVVGRLAAAQDHVAILVARGRHDRRVAALGHRQEMVRLRRGLDRVHGDLDVAVRAVLEPHRARQSRRELAVYLRLGGARADRAPADQVGDVLRADHVEVLGAGGHAHLADVQQQLARGAQAVVDLEAAVHVRVVDQALPAHRGTRLLEVHAHHHFQLAGEALALGLEQLGVVQCGVGIVDRAWSDDDDQPVIHAVQDAVHGLARAVDHVRSRF
ncbi:hypothetical protein D3C72_1234200 [compost metagenome]